MKLVTFQTMEALKVLINKGYLECDKQYIDINKSGPIYTWVVNKMNQKVKNKNNTLFPLWAWVKFKNGICPPKHKGKPVDTFEVKITFNKSEDEIFITDFRRYSFLLNNIYIPDSIKQKDEFYNLLKENNITEDDLKAYVRPDKYETHRNDKLFLDLCKKIENSFDKCITTDSDVLQGCVWRINLDEVEKIEILNDKNYRYGSFNYVRSNGKRFNWIQDFYKKLK